MLTQPERMRLGKLQKRCIDATTGKYRKNNKPAELEELARLIAKRDGKAVDPKPPKAMEPEPVVTAAEVTQPGALLDQDAAVEMSTVPSEVRRFVEQGYEYLGQASNGLMYVRNDKGVWRLTEEKEKTVLYFENSRDAFTPEALAELLK